MNQSNLFLQIPLCGSKFGSLEPLGVEKMSLQKNTKYISQIIYKQYGNSEMAADRCNGLPTNFHSASKKSFSNLFNSQL